MNGFLGSSTIEAMLGTSFVYLVLAVFCTMVNEWIAALLSARADTLRAAIRELLNDQPVQIGGNGADGFLKAFYAHPLVRGLTGDSSHPSWLTPRCFSAALIDLVTSRDQGAIAFADLENGIRKLPPGDVRGSLFALIRNTQSDPIVAQTRIEEWFNDAMKHASMRYKRRTQVWTLLVAAAVTAVVNADTVSLLRIHEANRMTALGWTSVSLSADPWQWASRLAGWLLTVAAVSLGAPFWFDLLNKVLNLKNERPAAQPESSTA